MYKYKKVNDKYKKVKIDEYKDDEFKKVKQGCTYNVSRPVLRIC